MKTLKKHFIAIVVVLFLAYIFFIFVLPELHITAPEIRQTNSYGLPAPIADVGEPTRLMGRFILQGSTCAGFEFGSDSSTVIWRNEIDCTKSDTNPDYYTLLAVHWLDANTFVTKDVAIEGQTPSKPPRVDIYTIVQDGGGKLILKKLWTGWGNFSTETLTFAKVK